MKQFNKDNDTHVAMFHVMSDGKWRTMGEILMLAGQIPEEDARYLSISSDKYRIDRRRVTSGSIYEYKLVFLNREPVA